MKEAKMLNKYIDKFKNFSAAKKSTMAFMFASFIQRGISFIVTPIFTRLLTTTEFGTVTVYNSWVEMIGTVAMLSLSSGIFNVGMMDYEDKRDSFTSSLLGLANSATVIVMIVFYAFSLAFPSVIDLPKSLYLLMLLYFIFQPATRFWTARQRFEYKYKSLTLVTIASALFSPAIGVLFVMLANSNKGVARLWGTNSVLILFGLFFYIYSVKSSPKLFNKKIWSYALKFSIPLLPHYLAMHILSTSDRVMIQSMIGTSEAGLYGLAYTASMVICTAWTAMQGSLTPYVYDKLKKDELDKIEPVAIPCIVLFSAMCIAVVLLAPEVVTILGGSKYAESVPLIPPLIASVLFMEMYNLFSMIEFYHKKTLKIMFATLSAAVINLILNFFAIRMFGYVAAAYTTLICYVLYSLFHYFNMRSIEHRKIYNGKFLVVFSIVYVLICFACLAMYPYPFVRYGLIIVILALAYIFRDKVKKIHGSIRKKK
ncbi:MAG: lipopolysaccharide biosynthesis protein [Lachnospira sp.]